MKDRGTQRPGTMIQGGLGKAVSSCSFRQPKMEEVKEHREIKKSGTDKMYSLVMYEVEPPQIEMEGDSNLTLRRTNVGMGSDSVLLPRDTTTSEGKWLSTFDSEISTELFSENPDSFSSSETDSGDRTSSPEEEVDLDGLAMHQRKDESLELRSQNTRKTELANHVRAILELLPDDARREGLVKTPLRCAEAYLSLTSGYHQSLEKLVNGAIFHVDSTDLVLLRNISIFSCCEHHILPFSGKCAIGYYPDGRVIGLSKLARIADMFAKRLQVQERLTNQIADAIHKVLRPKGVAVFLQATHMCMMMRGVCKSESETVSTAFRGEFKNNYDLRSEFLGLVQ